MNVNQTEIKHCVDRIDALVFCLGESMRDSPFVANKEYITMTEIISEYVERIDKALETDDQKSVVFAEGVG